jgi:DNA-binding XRE family transcriptional regulator
LAARDDSLPLAFSIARLFNRPIEAMFEPASDDSKD